MEEIIPTYEEPEGQYDQPFTWVANLTGLVSGSDVKNNSIRLEAPLGDFVLRRVAGFASVIQPGATGGRYQIKDYSSNFIEQDPVAYTLGEILLADEIPIVPELWYPELGLIRFDLYKVL